MLSEGVHDKHEVEEAEEEDIELVKPGEDPPKGLQTAEQHFPSTQTGAYSSK